MVDLQPMFSGQARIKNYKVPENIGDDEQGYEVTYLNGYKSWALKDVIDSAYYLLSEDNDGTKILKEDVEKLFPTLVEKGMTPELTYLYNVGHSKWGVRGMVNVFTAAANNQDVSLEGLQKVTGPLGIYL